MSTENISQDNDTKIDNNNNADNSNNPKVADVVAGGEPITATETQNENNEGKPVVGDDVIDENQTEEKPPTEQAEANETDKLLSPSVLSTSSVGEYPIPVPKKPAKLKCAPNISPDALLNRLEGTEKYISICKYLNIVPISRVLRHLNTEDLDLKHYGLSTKQMRAISETLTTNSTIKRLILEENWLTPDGANFLGNILRENGSIQQLNLKRCNLGAEGAKQLSEGLQMSQILQEIDLSCNSLGDAGMLELTNCLKENSSIRRLNLSHNELSEESAVCLERILLENRTVEHLDLAWNGFFTGPGNKKLFNGLLKNTSVTSLNMSWNGIGSKPATRPILKYLKKTEQLCDLDLSYNRLADGPLRMIRNGLAKNGTLERVRIGNNIYTPEEAFYLATALQTNKKSKIVDFNMENMSVQKEFIQLSMNLKHNILYGQQLARQLRQAGRIVTYGRVLDNYQIKGPDMNKLLFERCKFLTMSPKKKKQKKDFGHFLLELPDERKVLKDDFRKAIKVKKVKKMDEDLVLGLMGQFAANKKGDRIDYVTLKEAYMALYPDTVLPEKPPKKPKKGKSRKGKKGKGAATETPSGTDRTEAETPRIQMEDKPNA